MPNPKITNHDPDYPNPQINPEWQFLMRIIGWAIVGFLFLLWLCWHIPDQKDFWQALIGGSVSYLILLAMFFQARIYKRQSEIMENQWKAMRDGLDKTDALLKQNREFFEITERAYMGLKIIHLNSGVGVGVYPSALATFLNGGKTPAWNFSTRFRFLISTDPPRDILTRRQIEEWSAESEVGAFIPAGTEKTLDFTQDYLRIDTSHILEAIQTYVGYLYLIGEARYIDITQTERILPFFLVYDPNKGFVDCDVPDLAKWRGIDWSGFDGETEYGEKSEKG